MGGFDTKGQMKKKVSSIFVLFLLTLVFTPTVRAEVPDTCVPNEIIIKFRESAAKNIETQLDNPISLLNLSPQLTQLNSKYKVRQINSFYKNFQTKQQQLKSLRQKNKGLLTQKDFL